MASLPPDPAPLVRGNQRVKDARKLARRAFRDETGLFLADGPNAVDAALDAGLVREVFVTPRAARAFSWRERAERWTLVTEEAMDALSDSASSQGIVAVCRQLEPVSLDTLVADASMVAICVEVQDPGNAGTLIRCADAAGAAGVVLAGVSVDVHHTRLVRASAGSVFTTPVSVASDVSEVVRAVRDQGFAVLAADGRGELNVFDAPEVAGPKVAWLFGNEAHGLSAEVAALADHRVFIPLYGRAESLNLATAAAVCLYATAQGQRRT